MTGPRDPARNTRTCEHCAKRPADRLLFTMFMRCGYGDATKKTSYLCEECTREGVRWLQRIGFTVPYAIEYGEWDALVKMLPEAGTNETAEDEHT